MNFILVKDQFVNFLLKNVKDLLCITFIARMTDAPNKSIKLFINLV